MLRLLTISSKKDEEVLRQRCRPVTSIEEARPAVLGMKQWCESHTGLAGLSAPQVGISLRISFVWERGLQVVLINPEIMYEKGEVEVIEGCLSLPGQRYQVKRPKIIKVRYLDESWQQHSLKGHDFTANIVKHELDHLDGLLIDEKSQRKISLI